MKRRYLKTFGAFKLLLVLFFIMQTSILEASKTKKPVREPDILFVPTPQEVVDVMLRLADVKKGDVVYDLGCGDGRIVVSAAKRGATSFGYDIDPAMVKVSLDNVKKEKLEKQVTIQEKDIFKLDLSKASVVTLYLLPELNVRLIPQLEKLKPGSRIVSHDFDMEGVKPDVKATVHLSEDRTSSVYLWTTPLKKEKASFSTKEVDFIVAN